MAGGNRNSGLEDKQEVQSKVPVPVGMHEASDNVREETDGEQQEGEVVSDPRGEYIIFNFFLHLASLAGNLEMARGSSNNSWEDDEEGQGEVSVPVCKLGASDSAREDCRRGRQLQGLFSAEQGKALNDSKGENIFLQLFPALILTHRKGEDGCGLGRREGGTGGGLGACRHLQALREHQRGWQGREAENSQ